MNCVVFLQFLIISCFSIGTLCLKDNAFGSDITSTEEPIDLPKLEGRIVNGTKADIGQFPHQVSLRRSYSDSHFCGGNVIADQWILTAAHCMFNNNGIKISPWTVTVVAGQVLLRPNHPLGQRRSVAAIIVHSAYDRYTLTNDIALMKLTTPLMVNTSYVKVAKLEKTMPESGTMCQVSGWGYLAEDRKIVSNNLMVVSLPIISPARCRQLLVNVTRLPLGMFCAGYEEGLRDACQGDSGGGMICGNTLSGIVSGGEGCAQPALPGLYSNVAYYNNWIKNQINNFNETTWDSTNWKDILSRLIFRTNGSLSISCNLAVCLLMTVYSLLSYLGISLFDDV